MKLPSAERAQTLNHLAGAAQSFATIVALAVGGFWTYGVFKQTKQTQQVEENLATSRLNREKSAEEVDRQRRIEESKRLIVPAMEVAQISRRPRTIAVTFRFSNPGDVDRRLPLEKAIFRVRRVTTVEESGSSTFGPPRGFLLDLEQEVVTGIVLPGGGDMTLQAVQQVKDPGLYYVRFTAEDPQRPKVFFDLIRYVNVN